MPTQQNFNMYATRQVFFFKCSSIVTVFVVVVAVAALVVVAYLFCFVLLGIY